jgi:Protein of unknown function (DUF664)
VNGPSLEAAREILHDSLDALAKEINGVPVDDLNARPAGGESNSLAVIAVHALSSTRSWLSLASGAPLPDRDRAAEFRSVADHAFAASAQGLAGECRDLMASDRFDPNRTATAPWRSGELASEPVTASWALLHALMHLREHVGHAQMTRQLLDDGRSK